MRALGALGWAVSSLGNRQESDAAVVFRARPSLGGIRWITAMGRLFERLKRREGIPYMPIFDLCGIMRPDSWNHHDGTNGHLFSHPADWARGGARGEYISPCFCTLSASKLRGWTSRHNYRGDSNQTSNPERHHPAPDDRGEQGGVCPVVPPQVVESRARTPTLPSDESTSELLSLIHI